MAPQAKESSVLHSLHDVGGRFDAAHRLVEMCAWQSVHTGADSVLQADGRIIQERGSVLGNIRPVTIKD